MMVGANVLRIKIKRTLAIIFHVYPHVVLDLTNLTVSIFSHSFQFST